MVPASVFRYGSAGREGLTVWVLSHCLVRALDWLQPIATSECKDQNARPLIRTCKLYKRLIPLLFGAACADVKKLAQIKTNSWTREAISQQSVSPILIDVTRWPHAFKTTPMLLAVTPFPSPLTTPPVTSTYFMAELSIIRAACSNRTWVFAH